MALKKEFNAAAARALAKKKTPSGLQDILGRIERQAKGTRNNSSITIAGDLINGEPEKIVSALKAKGFKAEYIGDFRDGDYYQISW